MSSFKNILFPINGEKPALDYAIMMAKKSNARLHILQTYRLTDDRKRIQQDPKSAKDSLHQAILNQFDENYRRTLERSGLDFTFKAEIGFLTDRILTTIAQENIDMLLITKFYSNKDDNIIERISEVDIPVMLIPDADSVKA